MKARIGIVRKVIFSAAVLAPFVVAFAGCATEEGDSSDGEFALEEGATEEVGEASSAIGGCNQCSNCVDYARCRQPRLPHGLTSYSDKARIINTQNGHAGCVAIIRTGSYYGHVAYVNSAAGGKIHIDEGNWPSGHCGQRSGSKGALNISGFFCP